MSEPHAVIHRSNCQCGYFAGALHDHLTCECGWSDFLAWDDGSTHIAAGPESAHRHIAAEAWVTSGRCDGCGLKMHALSSEFFSVFHGKCVRCRGD